MSYLNLPDPVCHIGYDTDQVRHIVGARYALFERWMYGQTQAICEARLYDHEAREYKPSACSEAHGVVTYPWDVEAFLRGRSPLG